MVVEAARVVEQLVDGDPVALRHEAGQPALDSVRQPEPALAGELEDDGCDVGLRQARDAVVVALGHRLLGCAMKLLTPSRFVAFLPPLALAALGLAVAYTGASASAASAPAAVQEGVRARQHRALKLDKVLNVVAYYTEGVGRQGAPGRGGEVRRLRRAWPRISTARASRTSTSSTTRWRGAELPRSSSSFVALRRRSPTCTSTSGASSPNATSS